MSQKKIKTGEEKRKATIEEVKKLISAAIRQARYTTWLVNVVMITKSNEKWRM